MRFRYVLLPHGHVLGAHGGHHEECTMGRRLEEVVHGSHSSDGVDIAEILRVHHISCYQSVHAIGRLPAEEGSALQLNVVVVETLVEEVTNPLCYL